MRSQQQQQNGNGSAKTNAARNPEHDPGSRQNSTQSDGDEGHLPQYPIRSWELGSALRKKTPLNLIYAIPTAWMKVLSVDEDNEGIGEKYALKLSYSIDQSDQWLLVLEGFVTEVVDVFADEHLSNQLRESLDGSSIYEIGTDIFNLGITDNDTPNQMMTASTFRIDIIPVLDHGVLSDQKDLTPNPSIYQQKLFEPTELLLSPDMLPELFTLVPLDDKQEQEHVRDSGAGLMSPLELPPSSAYDGKAQRVVDLTGRVEKIGRFPEAHSGFVDVWKGVWKDVHGHERTVAVKVLRSRIGDPNPQAQ
ncbi:hypothetical protein D9758_015101 [Tetrapyrgos nigripes]|uniref:Uncharacterized protein n=1 Tax=Tetrapyrgos nigripes TaxID=182062 RepID=A0A8H5C0I7_9AGAR|nr:hypothetical protein D9758_015101 [Tetrapyrgos nigripes]